MPETGLLRRSRRVAGPFLALVSVIAVAAGVLVAAQPAAAADARLSLNAAVTATSQISSTYSPAKAVDARLGTKWASKHTNTKQWIKVDLGSSRHVSRIELRWSSTYAKSMRVQTSSDNATWSQVYQNTKAKGGSQTLTVSADARYVRVVGDVPSSKNGYQLAEFQVYGSEIAPTAGVHVTGTQGNWQLTVDGSPFTVKGVTYDPVVNDPATYLPDIRSMGANTVRDWGTEVGATTDDFFIRAAANHIRVIAGLWIDTNQDWTDNAEYQDSMIETISNTVSTYKNSDAVLMWNIGNEVMLNLPNDTQRIAYAKFVEKATQAIHAIDPDHPVTSTDAQTFYWPIYQQYTPSLDVFGLNTYQGIANAQYYWHNHSYDSPLTFTKPYVLTETGPLGWWGSETPADANGQPTQPTDTANAQNYVNAWNDITDAQGIALGGTMFHYSKETDLQATWFGIRPGDLKRASYYALAKLWGGTPGSNRPPVVSKLSIPASVAAGGQFLLTAPATDPDGDTLAWTVKSTAQTIASNGTAQTIASGTGGSFTLTAPSAAGVYRYYVYVTDGRGNVDIESKTVRVTAAG